jgi:molybdate transport system substrate-binding protein
MFRAAIVALTFGFCPVAEAAEIRVFAASSLTDALKEIGATYQAQSGTRISFNFAASSTLARQIEEGAPADVFVSADERQMDRLQNGNHVVAESRRNVLSNTLVLIAPVDSHLAIASPADLPTQVRRLALADPKLVPAGIYARAYLERAGVWEQIAPRVIPVENVRAVLAAVESGNVDAGFVYKTDAPMARKSKVVLDVPADDAPQIRYAAALVRFSKQHPEAAKFLDFLGSDEARAVFEKFGFVVQH